MYKTIKTLTLIIILSIVAIFYWGTTMNSKPSRVLKIGYPQHWGSLIPALQHTAYADAIILNQFEPLVEMGENGVISPLAASSWKISNDFKTFTFKIDTTKRFSNGEYLSAKHFKDAWEHGITLTPISHNKSPVDALYNLVGFDQFKEKGEITGIRLLENDTLQLEYKKPFRRALDHLLGGRYAAYIHNGSEYHGTGRFILDDIPNEKKVILNLNPFHKDIKKLNKAEISVVKGSVAQDELKKGNIDIYDFAEHANIYEECLSENGNISCLIGQEQSNVVIVLNGLNGRVFSNPKYRMAFQAMIARELKISDLPRRYTIKGFNQSYQIYLPFQKGVLGTEKVLEIIQQGEQYIDEFKDYTKQNPIYFVGKKTHLWMKKFLKENGVTLTENSGDMDWGKAIKMAYQTSDMDLFMAGFSIGGSDPDCLYHVLGKNGSILLPMMYREKTASLLEKGRELIDQTDMTSTYQQVTKSVLTEVPFVHLGTIHNLTTFRNDRVEFTQTYKKREDHKYHIYTPLK